MLAQQPSCALKTEAAPMRAVKLRPLSADQSLKQG
jgi:hypothetical protein